MGLERQVHVPGVQRPQGRSHGPRALRLGAGPGVVAARPAPHAARRPLGSKRSASFGQDPQSPGGERDARDFGQAQPDGDGTAGSRAAPQQDHVFDEGNLLGLIGGADVSDSRVLRLRTRYECGRQGGDAGRAACGPIGSQPAARLGSRRPRPAVGFLLQMEQHHWQRSPRPLCLTNRLRARPTRAGRHRTWTACWSRSSPSS